MNTYRIQRAGDSRSFPGAHPFIEAAQADGTGLVLIGDAAGVAYRDIAAGNTAGFVAIELGNECLGAHAGESADERRDNVVGFARFRLGSAEPGRLIELVRQPWTSAAALAAAKAAFEAADLVVAVCNDFPGRIVDRLVRPYYNAVLRRHDEGLATAGEIDKTLRLGLGYPEGPLALLERTGLEHHYDVTQALYVALGDAAYAPARRAQLAKLRSETR
ncbi:3-hydroxyacyl-CoA dehydrogenase family protein [Sinimarinibacterium flocculans]|uniref:3-hydroxyacyl-CoA dehydrogenase family protein n=1 Tax=Sinimarinibacterium flocculans TaxID=985250 RepID=UPI002492F6EF|nr:3-hydroxyacyl-CoA dehydrogenase family protein [Sinimarinibacterium flocculans]